MNFECSAHHCSSCSVGEKFLFHLSVLSLQAFSTSRSLFFSHIHLQNVPDIIVSQSLFKLASVSMNLMWIKTQVIVWVPDLEVWLVSEQWLWKSCPIAATMPFWLDLPLQYDLRLKPGLVTYVLSLRAQGVRFGAVGLSARLLLTSSYSEGFYQLEIESCYLTRRAFLFVWLSLLLFLR